MAEIELQGSVKAAAELHTIFRERFPSTNIFVDTSAGSVGPCHVALDDVGFECKVAMSAMFDPIHHVCFFVDGKCVFDSIYTDSYSMLEQIDQLVMGALQ